MKKTIRILIFAIVISAVSGFGTVGLSNDTFIKYGEKVLIKFKQLEQAEELLVLAPLPENAVAENVNIIKSNFFEDSKSYNTVSSYFLEYLRDNQIFTWEKFRTIFKVEYDCDSRDIALIFSTVDLWEGIPDDYNANSIDWVKFRATGKKVPYEYSFGDLYKREIYKSVNLIDPIYDAENAKEAFPINTKDSYDQYTACFNTESAIFSWMQFFAEDMADVIEVGIAYKAVRIAGQMFKGGNKKELTKQLIGNIKQELYKGNNLNNAVSKISDAKLQNYASSLKNSDNVLLKEIEKNADKVSVFSYATDDFAEIAHFEDDFLKVSDNAWADDAIEATKIETIADDIPIKNSAGDDLTGKVEIVEDADGRVWFRIFDDLGFKISDIRKLTGTKPADNGLTNLKKSMFENPENAIVLKPNKGILKQKVDEIVLNGDVGGAKTEEISDILYQTEGYIKKEVKLAGNKGIDGLYVKGSVDNPQAIHIDEAKFKSSFNTNGAQLNPANVSSTPPLPPQMTDDWIQNVANRMIQSGINNGDQELIDLGTMILTHPDKISKTVTAVDVVTKEINILKLKNYSW